MLPNCLTSQTASADFITDLFGDRFDLWVNGPQLRRVCHGLDTPLAVGRLSHPALAAIIRKSMTSGTAQCQSLAGGVICAVPVQTDQGIGAAVVSLNPAQAAEVLQRSLGQSMSVACLSRSESAAPAVSQDAGMPAAATDRRLRADESELNWLNQLPASVAPQPDDVAVTSVAARVLPELRGLVQARSLFLIREAAGTELLRTRSSVVWSSGEDVQAALLDRLLRRHRDQAIAEHGLCLNFKLAASSPASGSAILSALMMPVRFPGGKTCWLFAVNKDLRRLASGQVEGRYGTGIGAEDVEFGEAEINLMRAASSVLTTNSGIMELLHDRERLLTGVVRTLVNALDAKDSYTCGHSDRVAEFSRLTAQAMGVSARECERIHLAGLLHDIGKVGVPDEILNKPSGVTDTEMDIIRRHPVIGHNILQHLSSFDYVLPGVLHHHEAYDGSGYPKQLSGTDIPLVARIISVADAWDAMTSNRSYRAGMSPERAAAILEDGAGTQWDPQCVSAFLSCLDAVRLRMDSAHDGVAAPHMIRPASVSMTAHWLRCFEQIRE